MRRDLKKLKAIFSKALEIQGKEQREQYLNKACKGNKQLKLEVEALLQTNKEVGSFMETPIVNSDETLEATPIFEGPGTKIGRYELLELIGEGGMGLVYLACQKKPVKRQVALKIIKPGMDSRQVIARFEAEKQTLAVLDHPNIARVLDAGTTKEGRPYFIMEYVKGMSITNYCDQNKLNIEKRLRLFEQVCEGVHHAHQKGIIHRDIKPSNILVSVHGDRAVPKIIDFGIAKAVAQPLTDKTIVTFQGQLLGTPEYMSPEQVDMAMQDIDTRSDIYSLGVVLYELLAGVMPFGRESLAGLGFAEIQRTIREKEPSSPSTRLTSLGKQAKTIAESRGTKVIALARRLHRELEWIPLKAMRKDRCRRYRSTSEMADDIHNYLNGRPLIAGPETSVYRIKKFVYKHAGSVATVALITVAIVMGFIVSTAMYLRAEDAYKKEAFARTQAEQATKKEAAARAEAEQAKEKEIVARVEAERANAESQAIALFLNRDVINTARRINGREATMRDVLDEASKRLERSFVDQPATRATIHRNLSWTYASLGYFAASAEQQERAYRIHREQFGDEHSRPRMDLNWLSVRYHLGGYYKEAAELREKLVEQWKSIEGQVPSWLKCNLACAYSKLGRYEEAERLFVDAMGPNRWDDPNCPEDIVSGTYSFDLAKIFREQGRYEEAETFFVRILNAQRKRYGRWGDPRNRAMIRCMNELARLYVIQGHYEDADALFTEGISMGDRELPGKDHPYTLRHVNGLGVLRTKQGQYEEAEALFNRALVGRKIKLGEDHPYVFETTNDLGLLRREQQRYDEAEDLLTEALEKRTVKLGPDHPHSLESLHELGVLYLAQSRYKDAERRLLEALHGRETKFGPEHPQTVNTLRELARLYESWNKPNKADEYRARLPQVKSNIGYDRPVLIGLDTFASAGKMTYDDTNDTYIIMGFGKDISYNTDQFHFAHSKLVGDGSITARIDSVKPLSEWTKVGVMIRETTDANSAFAAMLVPPQNRAVFRYRSAMDESIEGIRSEPNALTLPFWVRLIREGNTFKAQYSDNGSEWKYLQDVGGQLSVMDINMNNPVLIGLAVCSAAGPGIPAEARISNVTLTGSVDPSGEFLTFEGIGFKVRELPDQ